MIVPSETGETGIERLMAYARQSDRDELDDIRDKRNELDARRALLSMRAKRVRDRLAKREREALRRQAAERAA